ncbi:transcriptional regulator [Pseudonocardia sulfidoxydans NBRC 16205]|uniref:Transcriptional regulator n=1 Tax=Pseudonocardia sulfidoxydans NBRC 16205 TaxID=1223511 RepID=A0A511DTE0_9PSEU|nr:MerR family transcriptional regulator [Pseudonocardia sulfidoxydans]GEL27034.1 transcriptional regulator [Pseudonocardia sulfidoxydans NBRC 16205]
MAVHPTEPAELTIDQLADRTGISVRTIRFYAGRGLVDPPRLRGRTGLYGPAHVARLELIGEMSALGFTLAAIERHLERVPHGAGPEDLALQRALLAPWVPEHLEDVDRAELDRRAGRPLDDAAVADLETLGVVEVLDDGSIRLHGTLGPGLDMLDSGLPPELLRDSHELIAKHTTALAEDLMALFQRQVLQPYRDAGRPAAQRARLAETLARLKPITVQGVVAAFGRAVNRTIRDRVG